ncbi:DUF4124 domain-containing protein [bacterium]|nr:DUF4124 domain-containing protein [bacterium]
MKVPSLIISAASLFLSASPVHADIMYQCVDESGHKSFSNIKSSAKGSKCISMDLGGSAGTPAASAQPRTATPASFPKVDPNSQKARDGDRRRILESELDNEQKNLELSKKELAEQEAIRNGDEKNYQRVLDRLQPFKDKVALHERNIEAIQKEIFNLR